MSKYIALVDCDSFFCSCERKLNPELNGKPLCVVSGERGCVIARSKEAKKMGVKMGDPLFKAVEEHPECIYMVANHSNYLKISKQIMYILKDISPNVEIYSIDEAFADLTGLVRVYNRNYYTMAQYIRDRIFKETGMPVSIGISRSKTLAKLASDRAKETKERIVLLGKSKSVKYLKKVDVSEVWGIGRRLTLKFQRYGIRTADEFVGKDDKWIKKNFGKNGLITKYELLGNSVLPITNNPPLPKSICDTQSFPKFTSDFDYIKNELMVHIHRACQRLRITGCKCSKTAVILKTKDFRCYFLDSKNEEPTDFELNISKTAFLLLKNMYSPDIIYRSVGILLEDFSLKEDKQLNLFENQKKTEKDERLGKAIDRIEEKFGRNKIKVGFTNKEMPDKQGFLTVPSMVY